MARLYNIGDVDLPGEGYPPVASFEIPFTDRLIGAAFLGDGEWVATQDWSDQEATFEIVGQIEFHDGFARLSGEGYIQTDIAERLAMTIVVAFRETTDTAVGVVGNFGGSANAGAAIFTFPSSVNVSGNTGRQGGVSGSFGVTSNTPDWGCYTLQVPQSGQARLCNVTTGLVAVSAYTADRMISGPGPLRIGRLYSASHLGPVDIAAVLIYGAALTDAEAEEAANLLQSYGADHGMPM